MKVEVLAFFTGAACGLVDDPSEAIRGRCERTAAVWRRSVFVFFGTDARVQDDGLPEIGRLAAVLLDGEAILVMGLSTCRGI